MELIKFRNNEYSFSTKKTAHERYKLSDASFKQFLDSESDGFYFSKALHIYGHSTEEFHDLETINNVFRAAYDFISTHDLILFGCDVFGNQFCFKGTDVVFFNLETCEIEPLANSFQEWAKVIVSDFEYFTGVQVLKEWEEIMLPLKINERFTPKKPFVIGGEYSPKNMLAVDFFKALEYNSSIAKQIYNLPDGTAIELSIPD